MYDYINPDQNKGLLYGSLIAAALAAASGRGGILKKIARGFGGGAGAYAGGVNTLAEQRKQQTEEDRMRELIESSKRSTELAGNQFGLEKEKWGTMQPYYSSEIEYNKALAESGRTKLIRDAADRERMSKAVEAALPSNRTDYLTPLRKGEGYKTQPTPDIEPLTKEMMIQNPESTSTQYLMGMKDKDKDVDMQYVGISKDKDAAPVSYNKKNGGLFKFVNGNFEPYTGQVENKVERTIIDPSGRYTLKDKIDDAWRNWKGKNVDIAMRHKLSLTLDSGIDWSKVSAENKEAIAAGEENNRVLDNELEILEKKRPMGTTKEKPKALPVSGKPVTPSGRKPLSSFDKGK
jgi:hypothetical protein